jgi:hypothetical protein
VQGKEGGREGGLDFGQPPGEAEENLEAWRGRGWPTPCLVVASVCCTLGSLAAFQLPPLPCLYVYLWPGPTEQQQLPPETTDALIISSHLIPSHIPTACIPFSFPFPIPIFIPLNSRTPHSLSISCFCFCCGGSISTACVCVSLEPSSACLLCLLTCYHSTAHSRSG